MWARSVMITTPSTLSSSSHSSSTRSTKLRSAKMKRSYAWLTICAIWVRNRPGLTVWQTAPMPEIA